MTLLLWCIGGCALIAGILWLFFAACGKLIEEQPNLEDYGDYPFVPYRPGERHPSAGEK